MGCLALPTVVAKDAAPQADAESAVIFGTSSTTRVGPPVAVEILRVNDEEYFVELHWRERKFWRVRPGEVQIKLYCSVVYKAGFARRRDGQYKLLKAQLEAGRSSTSRITRTSGPGAPIRAPITVRPKTLTYWSSLSTATGRPICPSTGKPTTMGYPHGFA